jgi:hypothetical protein
MRNGIRYELSLLDGPQLDALAPRRFPGRSAVLFTRALLLTVFKR